MATTLTSPVIWSEEFGANNRQVSSGTGGRIFSSGNGELGGGHVTPYAGRLASVGGVISSPNSLSAPAITTAVELTVDIYDRADDGSYPAGASPSRSVVQELFPVTASSSTQKHIVFHAIAAATDSAVSQGAMVIPRISAGNWGSSSAFTVVLHFAGSEDLPIQALTQTEYDALTPDAATAYLITG